MKKHFAILLLSALGLGAEIEFSGFFITSKEARFSLIDTVDGRSSGWLNIGESFRGYTIVSFDSAHDMINVRRDGQLMKVPLRASKVKDGRATISGTIKFLNDQIDGVRATLFMGEEAAFPLGNGVTFRIKPELLPDGNVLYRARFVVIGADDAEKTLAAPAVVAVPGKPFGIQIGELGYSFTPFGY